jgi:hypothetical protein
MTSDSPAGALVAIASASTALAILAAVPIGYPAVRDGRV